MKERKSGSAEWLVVQWKSIIEGSSIQKILKILHSLKKLTRKPQNEENIGTSKEHILSHAPTVRYFEPAKQPLLHI